MKNLCASMKPGSLLVVTVPASMALWSAWDIKHGHFRRYTKKSLLGVLPAGGQLMELTYLFPELFPIGLFRKRKLNKLPLSELNDDSLNFPAWPKWLNYCLELALTPGLYMRHVNPFGSSLMMVWKKESDV